MKTLLLFISLFLITVSYCIGQEKASLNSWRGLTLNETTIEAVKTKLGEPKKDKTNQFFIPIIYSKWFGNKPEKVFRKVLYEDIEGFDKVTFFFKDEKLVAIEFDLKKDLSASALVNAYDAKFYPLVGNYGAGITPTDLEKGDRELIYPDNFPSAFEMAAANKTAIGLAYASAGFAENLVAAMESQNRTRGIRGTMNGVVRRLQLVSRVLENMKGVDLLK